MYLLTRFLSLCAVFGLALLLVACADPWPDRPATYQDQINDNDLASVAMFLVDPERAAQVNQERLNALLAVQDKALSHEAQMAAAQAAFKAEQAQRNRDLAYAVAVVIAIAVGGAFGLRWILAAAVAMVRAWATRKPAPVYEILPDEPRLPGPVRPVAQVQGPQLPARIVTPGMPEFVTALATIGGWRGRDGNYYARRGDDIVRVDYFTEE